jgi:hypothetical protein
MPTGLRSAVRCACVRRSRSRALYLEQTSHLLKVNVLRARLIQLQSRFQIRLNWESEYGLSPALRR